MIFPKLLWNNWQFIKMYNLFARVYNYACPNKLSAVYKPTSDKSETLLRRLHFKQVTMLFKFLITN
jgi:hypothetical protein